MTGRALFARGHEQLDCFDAAGLATTIALLHQRAADPALAVTAGAARLLAAALESLLVLQRGDTDGAARLLQVARREAATVSDRHALAALGHAAACLASGAGQPAAALAELEAAWPLARQSGELRLQALYARGMASACSDLRQWDLADHWQQLALGLATEAGLGRLRLQCLLGDVQRHLASAASALAAGDPAARRQALERAARIRHAAGPLPQPGGSGRQRQLDAHIDRWVSLVDQGHVHEALTGLDGCLHDPEVMNDAVLQLRCLVHQAQWLLAADALEAGDAARSSAQALVSENRALRHRAEALERSVQKNPRIGAVNRLQFDAHLQAAHAEAAARDMPLCLARLDAEAPDPVARRPDTAAMEQALARLVLTVLSSCRKQDTVALLGEGKLAIVFVDIGLGRAQAVCQRIRRAVQRAAWQPAEPGLALALRIGVADISALPSPAAGLAAAEARAREAGLEASGHSCQTP